LLSAVNSIQGSVHHPSRNDSIAAIDAMIVDFIPKKQSLYGLYKDEELKVEFFTLYYNLLGEKSSMKCGSNLPEKIIQSEDDNVQNLKKNFQKCTTNYNNITTPKCSTSCSVDSIQLYNCSCFTNDHVKKYLKDNEFFTKELAPKIVKYLEENMDIFFKGFIHSPKDTLEVILSWLLCKNPPSKDDCSAIDEMISVMAPLISRIYASCSPIEFEFTSFYYKLIALKKAKECNCHDNKTHQKTFDEIMAKYKKMFDSKCSKSCDACSIQLDDCKCYSKNDLEKYSKDIKSFTALGPEKMAFFEKYAGRFSKDCTQNPKISFHVMNTVGISKKIYNKVETDGDSCDIEDLVKDYSAELKKLDAAFNTQFEGPPACPFKTCYHLFTINLNAFFKCLLKKFK